MQAVRLPSSFFICRSNGSDREFCATQVRALLSNKHISLEPYIDQLIPAVLTCVVGKRLCGSPLENHWKLRDDAAELVSLICEKCGPAYETLQPRITKTLLGAFTTCTRGVTAPEIASHRL